MKEEILLGREIFRFLKNKKGMGFMDFLIYAVILIVFLGLMIYIFSKSGLGGWAMIKRFLDSRKFGT